MKAKTWHGSQFRQSARRDSSDCCRILDSIPFLIIGSGSSCLGLLTLRLHFVHGREVTEELPQARSPPDAAL